MLSIITVAGIWKIFRKAGRPGWAAIVPVYNQWVAYEIVGKPGWWAVLSLIPVVNLIGSVLAIIATVDLAKVFGKKNTFSLLLIFQFSYYTENILEMERPLVQIWNISSFADEANDTIAKHVYFVKKTNAKWYRRWRNIQSAVLDMLFNKFASVSSHFTTYSCSLENILLATSKSVDIVWFLPNDLIYA